jgi:hypothetical protein
LREKLGAVKSFFQTWTTLKVDRGDTLGRFENTFTDETDEANRDQVLFYKD